MNVGTYEIITTSRFIYMHRQDGDDLKGVPIVTWFSCHFSVWWTVTPLSDSERICIFLTTTNVHGTFVQVYVVTHFVLSWRSHPGRSTKVVFRNWPGSKNTPHTCWRWAKNKKPDKQGTKKENRKPLLHFINSLVFWITLYVYLQQLFI